MVFILEAMKGGIIVHVLSRARLCVCLCSLLALYVRAVMCVCVCMHVLILCVHIFAMLCMKMFVNFHRFCMLVYTIDLCNYSYLCIVACVCMFLPCFV